MHGRDFEIPISTSPARPENMLIECPQKEMQKKRDIEGGNAVTACCETPPLGNAQRHSDIAGVSAVALSVPGGLPVRPASRLLRPPGVLLQTAVAARLARDVCGGRYGVSEWHVTE